MADDELAAIEELAVELALLAGAEIENALGKTLSIRYKGQGSGIETWRDPVSEVDHRAEQLIRLRLAEHYPGHGIIGEEMEICPGDPEGWIWAIDPIDGTANFINGFPLFAASIGVLRQGRPMAGAIWCSATHALRPGVYHAREGGALRFDRQSIAGVDRAAVRRPLVGEPAPSVGDFPWDVRKTGSAAIESAFVAAGLLRAARFESPNLWDVAGGLPLVMAAGGSILEKADGAWRPFVDFGRDAADWRAAIILGDADAALILSHAHCSQ